MNRNERDELHAAQHHTLVRIADALEAPQRAVRQGELLAAFPMPERIFGGERGAVLLLRSIPGFAGLWETVVPDAYVRAIQGREGEKWHIVSCPCSEHVALRPGAIADCPGGCGRFYFDTGELVRVKRFELEAAA